MKTLLLAALATASLLIAGCGNSTTAGESGGAPNNLSKDAGKPIRVGIVFDTGGRGDKSFNDSAWAGLERAQKELGAEPKTVESKSEKDYETNLSTLAESGCELVIAVGINMQTALKAVAPKFPDVKFATVDGDVPGDNVRSLQFKEAEGSFLAGYLAGLMSKSGKLGFVGGQEIPLIKRFECGYIAGAKSANPNVVVLPAKYANSWNNADLAKAAANVLFSDGADIIYHAAGASGLGVIGAAAEQKKFAIGVDSDQDYIQPGFVLTSMIKRVDEAVFQTVSDIKNGSFTSGVKVFDLKANGVGLSEMKHTKDKIPADVLAKVEQAKADIIAGKIQVPSKPEELEPFLAALPK